MADSAVNFVVGRLADFAAKESKLLQEVGRTEVVLLKDKLQWLQTFVQLADHKRRLEGNAYVDVWVQQTREVALDSEDVVDKFLVRVNLDEHLPVWWKCLRFVGGCFTQISVRHELSGKIAVIRARLDQISQHKEAYMKDYSSEATSLVSRSLSTIDGWYESYTPHLMQLLLLICPILPSTPLPKIGKKP
jgi:hypothetical protein